MHRMSHALLSLFAGGLLASAGCGSKDTKPAPPAPVGAADVAKPALDEQKPLAGGDEQVADDDKPVADDDKPVADGDEPVADGDEAAADGDKPPELSPDTAILLTRAGLVAVDGASGEVKTLAAGVKAGSCVVDPKARVVWLVSHPSEDGAVDGGLAAFDLEGGEAAVVVAPKLPEVEELALVYGKERLGGADPVSFSVGLTVTMGAEPALAALFGCEGDREWYCYEDAAADERSLLPELKARKAALDAAKPADPALLARWAARGAGRPLVAPRTPDAKQPTERVAAVSEDDCEAVPELCGTARVVEGTPFWRVVTANTRGDFYYQSEQLYDPRDKTFFDIAKPGVRSAEPLAESTDLEGVVIAPSGAAFLANIADAEADYAPVIGTFDGKIVHRAAGATACGWVGGGWRIPGPRG